MSDKNYILFEISRRVCGKSYFGSVKIDIKSGEVDLLGLCDDDGLYIRGNNRNLLQVQSHLKAFALRKLVESNPNLYGHLSHLYCVESEYNFTCFMSDCVTDYKGDYILKSNAYLYNDKYYVDNEHIDINYKYDEDSDGESVTETLNLPRSVVNHCFYYCDDCHNYVDIDNYNDEKYCCKWCEAYRGTIENYGYSHTHNDFPLYFTTDNNNKVISSLNVDDFSGLGFELEVQNYKQSINHNKVAYHLIKKSGLLPNELRYAWDGSVNRGFEIISQPHTIKAFYAQKDKIVNMLNYLVSLGYTSHERGECGLHIHISRRFFGKTQDIQDSVIAKIMAFYDNNWNDIVRVSRREYFGYCSKNQKHTTFNKKGYIDSKYDSWKKHCKCHSGSHGVALNNGNSNTFEFRLGRGTLNPLSFFAWFDFTLTLCKNAKRITVEKINSNDKLSFLAGISETTARYMYKREAFTNEIIKLFPSIAWDNNIEY